MANEQPAWVSQYLEAPKKPIQVTENQKRKMNGTHPAPKVKKDA